MVVATKARHTYGHLFSGTSPLQNNLLKFFQWIVCSVVLTPYCFTSFVYLRLDLTFAFYRSTYFIGHMMLIGGLIIFSGGSPKPSHDAKEADSAVTSQYPAKPESHKDAPVSTVANNNALHRLNRKLQ
ncbi:hypothetical protein ACROYT_G032134 [Oculina patagonica]